MLTKGRGARANPAGMLDVLAVATTVLLVLVVLDALGLELLDVLSWLVHVI